jgi:hypothetical protein
LPQRDLRSNNPHKSPFFPLFQRGKIDELVKSQIGTVSVIPAKAGIQLFQDVLDPGFRRGDDWSTFYEIIKI